MVIEGEEEKLRERSEEGVEGEVMEEEEGFDLEVENEKVKEEVEVREENKMGKG